MEINDEWFRKVCDSYLSPPQKHNGKILPGFPSDEIQRNTTGQAGVETLEEAFVFYEDCAQTFAELGRPMAAGNKLLDFGVGWGRIARFFLKELELSDIHGLDVTDDFIAICRESFDSKQFNVCNPFPPSCLPDGDLDFIVGYSVFSHLSEDACKRWMAEFNRVLSPGGLVALTTRGRPFFDSCENLKGQGHTGYMESLSLMFTDFDHARECYDRGDFVHSNRHGVTGGGAMNADFYGETFIPEAYAKTAYSEHFRLEKFLYDPLRQTHPIMFFRKR